ncbi:MAG: diguanylate cyclase [Coriobacteriales bacterium]|nr:diguanylate cyclase [Coriobacteriales bacterium]
MVFLPVPDDSFADKMRELLGLCIRIDEGAQRTYEDLADRCSDTVLAEVFSRMGADERAHQEWWTKLLEAYDAGLVPELSGEMGLLLDRLREIAAELDQGLGTGIACDDLDAMLETAARLEFFMLDPVFGELIELTEPGNTSRHLTAYGHHIERLAGAIEGHYRRNELAVFLAGVLRRSWRDFFRAATLTRYDQLTHALNRRGFLVSLDQWAAWSSRYGRPLAVVVMDLDNFKRINDTHGHAAGDLALVAFANAVRETVRESDLIGRQGGDEFAVIAPETDEEALTHLLDRIVRDAAAKAQREWPYRETTPISVSAGGAWTAGDDGVAGDTLLTAADDALYAAKAEGRSRASAPVRVSPGEHHHRSGSAPS